MRGWEPNDLVENTPVFSANGRFCIVVRWYPTADFTSERAGKVFGLDEPDTGEEESPREVKPAPTTVVSALYENVRGSRQLISEITLDNQSAHEVLVLVSDSG